MEKTPWLSFEEVRERDYNARVLEFQLRFRLAFMKFKMLSPVKKMKLHKRKEVLLIKTF